MKNPCISVDRQAQKYAIFDGLECIGGFEAYTDEAAAESEARAAVAALTDKQPEIVYPAIRRMVVKKSRINKRSR